MSGRNCLQIDNSGYISNSGSGCGSSQNGIVNTGNAGQVAYYTGNGNVIAGMNAVAVSAGGTGASTAAQALANLGGQPAIAGVNSDGANGLSVAGSVAAGSVAGLNYISRYQGGTAHSISGFFSNVCTGPSGCIGVADPTLSLTEQPSFINPVPNMGPLSTFVDQRSGIANYSHNWQTAGKNFGTNSALFDYCLRETWIPIAGFSGHSGCHDEYSADTTPGWTFGNGGTSTTGWYIPVHKIMNFTVNGSGISGVINATLTKYGAGDAITGYFYNTGMGGYTAASDEGAKALGMGMIENTSVYTGTCQSGCSSGSTLVKTTAVTGSGTQGTNRYLIDTTQAPITGQVTNIAAGLAGSGGSALTVTATVPVSNAWGTISTPNPSTPVNPQPPFSTSETFVFSITNGAFDTTHVACFSNHYHECFIPYSVSAVGVPSAGLQTVTAYVRKGHITGDAVCQGGLAGYALELTSYTQSGVRYPFDVWCSTGANTIQSLSWIGSAAQVVPFTSAIYTISNFTGLTNQIACTAVANGTGVYTCAVPAGGSGLNPYNGKSITFSGFAQGTNNGTFTITSATATSITTNNASSATDTTGVATTTVMSATYNATGSTLYCPTCQTKGTFAIASSSDAQLNGNCNNVVWSSSAVMTCNASNISDTATHTSATATGANSQPGSIVGLNNFNLWPMAEVIDVQNEIGPFTLSAASTASGGNTTYTGTGLTNTCPSSGLYNYSVTGFTNAGNNVTNVACVSSTATTLVLTNSGGVAETNPGGAGIAKRLDGTFALEPNPMTISPGDTLEETHLEAAKYQAYSANVTTTNPWNIQFGTSMTVAGSGAVGGSSSLASNARMYFANLQPDSFYRGIGTGFQTASNLMTLPGPYNIGFLFDHGPQLTQNPLLQLTTTAAQYNDTNYSYYPFFLYNKSGQTYLQVTPNTGNTVLATTTQGTVSVYGASGTMLGQNGQTTTFPAGSTVAFTGATVTGLPNTTTWNSILAPTANAGFLMGNFTTAITYGAATVGNMFSLTDSASNTGANAVLAVNTNATSSAFPFQISAKGTTYFQWQNNGTLSMLNGAQQNVCGTCNIQNLATAATSGVNQKSAGQIDFVSVWNGSAAASGNCNRGTQLVSTSATNSNSYWGLNCTAPTGTTMDVRFNGVTDLQVPGIISTGTRFSVSGCSATATSGGATAGLITLGANSCTVVVTPTGITAPSGWTCSAHDRTAPTVLIGGESSSTTTTASIPIPAGAGTTDVISFSCTAY